MSVFQSSTTVLDSILFRDAFGTPAMRQVFSDRAFIARCVEVEVALAKAEARCGVIPEAAAGEIARLSNAETLDFEHLGRETDIVGYPILPLVHQLAKQCGGMFPNPVPACAVNTRSTVPGSPTTSQTTALSPSNSLAVRQSKPGPKSNARFGHCDWGQTLQSGLMSREAWAKMTC